MERFDLQLTELLAKAEEQGYLTYDQVNAYLPDETTGTEAVDRLLSALDRHGIEVMDDPKSPFALPALDDDDAAHEGSDMGLLAEGDLPKLTDDPIRMYLSQMAKIPLLTREQEISLAKKIEITRKRFRRNLLSCHFALAGTVKTLHRVHQGELPFDRTIKVSLTEDLTKEQILRRMPRNLPTLDHLLEADRRFLLAEEK